MVEPTRVHPAADRRAAPAKSPARLAFLLALGVSGVALAWQVPYRACFSTAHEDVSVSLRSAALWSRTLPPPPAYASFPCTTPGVDGYLSPAEFDPRIVVDGERAIFRGLLGVWLALVVAAFVHLVSGVGRRDRFARALTFAAIGSCGGVLMSLSGWLAYGGWGPGMLLELGIAGAMVGIADALWFVPRTAEDPQRRRRSRDPAEIG